MMENMQYAEEIVREFLVFRGFTSTLQIYENELSTDIGAGFQVDKILELIFSVYVPNFHGDKLVSLLTFLKQCVCSSTETVLISTLSKLEVSALKYYVVHALQSERRDKVVEFFETNGNDLLQRHSEWMSWFAIPYLKNPKLNPQFRVYFSKEWYDALLLSFRNFLNEIFNGIRIPALLKISTEKNTVKHLKTDIKQLNTRLSELQALLEVRETEIQLLRSMAQPGPESSLHWMVGSCSNSSLGLIPLDHQSNILSSEDFNKHSTTVEKKPILNTDNSASSSSNVFSETTPNLQGNSSTTSIQPPRDERVNKNESWLAFQEGRKQVEEEEFPEVKVEFQESFLGHTSPISKCRFSASGSNIASASIDGTVRVWTYDESTPTSRNATIYCGAEIMSLDWECRYDRLLLIGTADGGIKAWNVDAKRVVCDLSTTPEFPSVLDLKCSPVEPIFVSAASSRRSGSDYNDGMGFASLTVWNMKTWKAMTILPLGKDPPTITSMCFNHNGKILAAAATDGMIHMFDMSAGLQITGWPAHDSAVSSVLFGPDETSIFSLGSDGKIFEWSLQNQGQVLWSRDCRSFFSPESSNICRHEIALDSNGRRLLVTSDTVRSPLYQVQGHLSGLKSLAHSSRITTVDWHPTLPIYVTGSADHSVRVTCTL